MSCTGADGWNVLESYLMGGNDIKRRGESVLLSVKKQSYNIKSLKPHDILLSIDIVAKYFNGYFLTYWFLINAILNIMYIWVFYAKMCFGCLT